MTVGGAPTGNALRTRDTSPRRGRGWAWYLTSGCAAAASLGAAVMQGTRVSTVAGYLGTLAAVVAAVAGLVGVVVVHRALAACRREVDALDQSAEPLRDLAAAEVVRAARQPDDLARAEDTPAAAVARTLGNLPVPILRERLEKAVREVRTPGVTQPEAMSDESPRMDAYDVWGATHAAICLGVISALAAAFGTGVGRPWSDSAIAMALGLGAGVLAQYSARVAYDALDLGSARAYRAVDEVVADRFNGVLPRDLGSPERRLEVRLNEQLTRQTERLTDLLAEGLAAPAQALADHAGALAHHSAAWGETAQSLHQATSGLVASTQKRVDEMAAALRERSAEMVRLHSDAVGKLLEEVARQHARDNEASARRARELIEEAAPRLADVVAARVAAMESAVSGSLEAFREALPQAVRQSLAESVSGAVDLTDLLREQAAVLAQSVHQVSQNADRQVQAYERWAERATAWQTRLEQVLTEAQAAHERTSATWHERAEAALGQVEGQLARAADASSRGQDALVGSFRLLADQMREMRSLLGDVRQEIAGLRSTVGALQTGVQSIEAPLNEAAQVAARLTDTSASLTKSMAAAGTGEVRHAEALRLATQAMEQLAVALAQAEQGLRRARHEGSGQ